MSKFVFAYRGGAMASTPEEGEATMKAWMDWFGELGDALLDAGSPFGANTTVEADAQPSESDDARLTGYSIVDAEDLASAAALAQGCPVLSSGGSVDVYEAIDVI